MGCTIYAASPEALPGEEATGRDHRHHHRPHVPCNQKIAARPNTMTEHQEQNEEGVLVSTQDLEPSKHQDAQGGHPHFRLIDDLSYEDVKKCYRGSSVSCSGVRHAVDVCVCVCSCVCGSGMLSLVQQSSRPLRERASAGLPVGGRPAKELLMTLPCPSAQTVSKYNSQYHKLFQCVPKEEILMKVYSCALLRDILLQGRLYISRNWLCFYANLFGKDIKVAIPVVSVRLVKKHKTAGLVPNGLAITTDTSQKYVFVSLLSRDSVYDVLRRICTHLQVNGKKSLSLKHYMEVPHTLSLDEYPVADEFPVADEYPPVLKWRRKPSVVSVSSSLPDLLGSSTGSLTAVDSSFQTDQPLEDRSLETEKILLTEPVPELGPMEYQLLKFFIILLEHQLSFLNNPTLPLRER
ncbi:GRAM domain-containing protein 2A isoform X3 [Coregonus clupeaformis]|uniref:GRAM domain-containing protein 2A isoform X3 n=1 Tax=Coregonus clupeaformis TaxID=59861 RepID=UPI001BE0C4C0|nr:GRAM domain-containing protein 2A isoform X3 [Coregonus clupeaformis]